MKKPTITNFPPEKPMTAAGQRHSSQYKNQPNGLAQKFMHYRGLASSQSPNHPPKNVQQDLKDLSFTLMNKTNQEFFQLLQRYGDLSNLQPQNLLNFNFVRSNTSMAPTRKQTAPISSTSQNQQLLSHLQNQRKNQNGGAHQSQHTSLVLGDYSQHPTDRPSQPHLNSSRNTQILHSQNKVITAAIPSSHSDSLMLAQNDDDGGGDVAQIDAHYGSMMQAQAPQASLETKGPPRRKGSSQRKVMQSLMSNGGASGASTNVYGSIQMGRGQIAESVSESPIKRQTTGRVPPQSNQGNIVGRLGNFVLMVDGKGVGSTKQNQNRVKLAQNMNQSLISEGDQQLQRSNTTNLFMQRVGEKGETKKHSKKDRNLVTTLKMSNQLSTSMKARVQQEETPQKRFQHSRHSSQAQQNQQNLFMQDSMDILGNDFGDVASSLHAVQQQQQQSFSPSNNPIVPRFASNMSLIGESSLSPQKRQSTVIVNIPSQTGSNYKQNTVIMPPYQNVVQSTSSKRNSIGKKTVINFYKGQVLSSGGHLNQGDESDVYKNQISDNLIQKSSTGFNLDREDQESSPLKVGGFSSQLNAVQSLRLIRSKAPDSQLNEQESMASIVQYQQNESTISIPEPKVMLFGPKSNRQGKDSSPMKNQVLIDMFRQAHMYNAAEQAKIQGQKNKQYDSASKVLGHGRK